MSHNVQSAGDGGPPRSSTAAPSSVGGNPALRMLGLPSLRARVPSRNWLIFLGVTGSFTAAVLYDRRERRKRQQRWCNAVSHLAYEPLAPAQSPRRVTVVLEAPPGDNIRPAREYFHEYVKPILVAAALDWDVVEGRREGAVRAKMAERIRDIRRKSEEAVTDDVAPDAVEETRRRMGVLESTERGGDLVIGRHTWKEYIRGLHEGWLGPLEDPSASTSPSATEESPTAEPHDARDDLQSSSISTSNPETIKEETDKTTTVENTVRETESESESEPTPEPKPEPKKPLIPIPYLTISEYASSQLAPSIPESFPPSIALPLPHLLGFLNTPTRMYRFLRRRDIADETGQRVVSLILSDQTCPYSQQNVSLSDPAIDDATPPNVSSDESTSSTSAQWEQQQVLAASEQDWHKSAFQDSKDPASEQAERVWREPIVIDARIGKRMRKPESVHVRDNNSTDMASAGEKPFAQTDGKADISESKSTGSLNLDDESSRTRDPSELKSRTWKGGADPMREQSWGQWLRDLVGMTDQRPSCRGWEDGLVGGDDS